MLTHIEQDFNIENLNTRDGISTHSLVKSETKKMKKAHEIKVHFNPLTRKE